MLRNKLSIISLIVVLLISCSGAVATLHPQETATDLTSTAVAITATTPSEAPTKTPTNSIVEITGTPPTQPYIQETGTPLCEALPEPGRVKIEKGTYMPYRDQYIRLCPNVLCQALPRGLTGFHEYPTQGMTQNENHELWLCEIAYIDTYGGAEICDNAIAWWTPTEKLGTYQVLESSCQ